MPKTSWDQLGVIYKPDGSLPWARTHATCPTPMLLADRIRLYLQCRDENGVGRVGFIDLDREDPTKVLHVHPTPVLDIGLPGTFDENGVLETCILDVPGRGLFMYYVGFELGTKIRYRLLTGLAISPDGVVPFERVSKAPILERTDRELYFRGGPYVVREGSRFRMWYVGGSDWETVNGKSVPIYDLRYMESDDGVHWPTDYTVCMRPRQPDELGFGRPYVRPTSAGYELHYSIRQRAQTGAYTVGYATSPDGLAWTRDDDRMDSINAEQGWCADGKSYSAPLDVGAQSYVFFNGNDYGVTGVGVARLRR